jgi:hypothetical protein
MVIEYSKADMESMRQATYNEVVSLKDYLNLLGNVLADAEQDVIDTKAKAKVFVSIGQSENHGYLQERIAETEQRIEIIKKCMSECSSAIDFKDGRIKYFDDVLKNKSKPD